MECFHIPSLQEYMLKVIAELVAAQGAMVREGSSNIQAPRYCWHWASNNSLNSAHDAFSRFIFYVHRFVKCIWLSWCLFIQQFVSNDESNTISQMRESILRVQNVGWQVVETYTWFWWIWNKISFEWAIFFMSKFACDHITEKNMLHEFPILVKK